MATASRHPARPGEDPAAAQHAHAHGSVESYKKGFIYALILTVIPFFLVMTGLLPKAATLVIIYVLAVVQMAVHLVYFLHMKTGEGERWTLMAFIFTVIVVGILAAGSLWIMYSMNANMMVPMDMTAE